MDKFELQRLRDLPIEGVAERLGLRVTRHKSLCPFHDDHNASLSYHTGRNTCRCFVCMDESMGTIDLVMKHLRLDFKDACRWLADSHNVILEEWKPTSPVLRPEHSRGGFNPARYEGFFLRPFLSQAARHFLFDERHLDPRVIAWCRITSWRDRDGIDWLQTPYYDMDGHLIGIQNRNLQKGASPRFRFPYGSRCGIYNLPVLKMLRPGEELWITEGCSDCWAMLSSGHKAIAIPSATLLSPKDKELLSSFFGGPDTTCCGGERRSNDSPRLAQRDHLAEFATTIHMYPDKDTPGERLFLQLKELLPGLVHHHLPMGCKDYSDYYITHELYRKTKTEKV